MTRHSFFDHMNTNFNANANLYGTNLLSAYGNQGAYFQGNGPQGNDPLTQLLQQLGGALQDPQASATDVLSQLLDTLSNSADPTLQQLADDCSSSDAYASGSGSDEVGAYALLQQLYSALAQYRQTQSDYQQFNNRPRSTGGYGGASGLAY